MSQVIFSSINPSTTSGTQLATILDDFKDAVVSGFTGTSRPTNLNAGGYWIDTTNDPIWTFKIWDGTDEISLFDINTTTNLPSYGSSDSEFTINKSSDDTVAALFKLYKSRAAGDGQTLSGDDLGEIRVYSKSSDATTPNIAKLLITATEDTTSSTQGVSMTLSLTRDGESALTEVLRAFNGRMGINLDGETIDSDLHIKGDTGFKIEQEGDNTTGGIVTIEKKRVASSGQVLSGDNIGVRNFVSTDEAGDPATVATETVAAIENHTSTAHGVSYKLQLKEATTTTLRDRLFFGDDVAEVYDSQLTLNKGRTGAVALANNSGIRLNISDGTDIILKYDTSSGSLFSAGEEGAEVPLSTAASVETLTNKDLDGGVASNTNRITLPKNTTVNLSGLTNKEATIAYDTTLATIVVNNGAGWNDISGLPTGSDGQVQYNNGGAKGGATSLIYDDSANRVQIQQGSESLRIGADSGATTITNNTTKETIIVGPNYTSDTEEDVTLIYTQNSSSSNRIYYGGAPSSYNAATDHYFYTAANTTTTTGTLRARISNTGLGINGNPSVPLDVWDGSIGFVIGADSGAITRTNATQKVARMAAPHYTNAEEQVCIAFVSNTTSANEIAIGGGTGTLNAATAIRFYTAANNTTVTGTERVTIDSDGNVGINASNPTGTLDVQGSVVKDRSTYSVNPGNIDAANKSILQPSVATTDIQGFSNGVDGQVIDLFAAGGATTTIRNNNASGTQKVFTPTGADLVIAGPGGARLICNGTAWYVTSYAL